MTESQESRSQRHEWITRGRNLLRRSIPFVSGMLATLLGLVLYAALFPPPQPISLREVNDTVVQAMASATPAPAYSALVYQAIRPSLVLIEVETPDADGNAENGLGSGVVINEQGDILTSLHVVEHATSIVLTFADGARSQGAIVAAQPENDIAVVQALDPPEVFYPATLGSPGALRIGDEAFAVGHPYGLYGSMSSGVISGFDRTFQPKNGQRIEGLIQIDAAVNPGNSGGPLLNRYGQVVGIVTGLANPTEQDVFIGIGFAVPINVAGTAAGLPPY
jgi:S1-C subfamily serine protease